MHEFKTYHQGETPIGSIVVKLYRSGDEPRGYIRETHSDAADDELFPSEEMEPEVAFRLAENKLVSAPDAPIYIELEDVRWNPAWGRLVN